MLCTRCSELIKPVVALDIDGTLGDYHGHFWDFAREWIGSSPSDLESQFTGEQPYSQWFCDLYGVDLTTFRQIKLAYRQGGMKRTMPVFDLASELSSLVCDLGAELWLTTTRPYLSLDGVDRDTRHWLYINNIRYHRLMYDENKYSVLAERVDKERIVAVVDDEKEQCEIAQSLWGSGVPIQRGTQFNEDALFFPRIDSLITIMGEISRRIAQWKD